MIALNLALSAWGHANIDAFRHAIERIPGPDYLAKSYYERWFEAITMLAVERGVISNEEAQTMIADPAAERRTPPLPAERVPAALASRNRSLRHTDRAPRFKPGDTVRARDMNPGGHTRLPRYVRGRSGLIECDHGAHVLPDSNAHFRGERPERLYGVVFTAKELWGGPRGDTVRLDLWESYLEPS